MAAIDIPWLTHMSTPGRQRGDTLDSASSTNSPNRDRNDEPPSYLVGEPRPTIAPFSPATLSSSSQPISAAKRLSTILVHQKSPLLLATPPQVTRALAYSHPFLLPLNKFVALLSWTTGDPWESFLLVAVFWATVLYGGVAVRLGGPLALILFLILGMYARRFSPLSSSGWSEDGGAGGGVAPNRAASVKGKNKASTENPGAAAASVKASAAAGSSAAGAQQNTSSEATNTKHQKTLDEIVETLKDFTARCNILMEPLLALTDFLSTQRTATSATTRPALTTLFVRILMCTPLWIALTLPPFRVITTRRVILVFGTIILTWHARVVKAGRTILWRSASVRRLAALLTGLDIPIPDKAQRSKGKGSLEKAREVGSDKAASAKATAETKSELTKAIRRARGATNPGVRFTFIIYENQRRWVGLGWTNSLFAYERAAWTDEHNNPVPPKEKFELPEVEDGMRWRWVDGSRWRVDGVPDEAVSGGGADSAEGEWNYDGEAGKNGWVFYDNKWQLGRRGQDGWGRWTRRRKWYRDAELVEVGSDDEAETERNRSEKPTSRSSSESRGPALPPRPKTPTLAPPVTTISETTSMPDLRRQNDTLNDIREEAETDHENAAITAATSEKDDNASVLSTSSRSTRFRVPSLRRRITENSNKSQQKHYKYDDITSSPRSISVSAYSVGRSTGSRSRRTSEVQSEDDAASLGPVTGLEISKNRNDSWGVGDEVVMGLE
ncbi:Peroxisomal membrane protein PEX30 [Cytospora mali]|uniref:Peroxisomal membrane protein PEX30 n=1 Tax=Cytospora mali TaxID=578113 RepID=A0A194UVH1_CYTMA|nr:Peroxisomal membrane protein PEX30 [Valsa mali var. pyri (nom. inval.)]